MLPVYPSLVRPEAHGAVPLNAKEKHRRGRSCGPALCSLLDVLFGNGLNQHGCPLQLRQLVAEQVGHLLPERSDLDR